MIRIWSMGAPEETDRRTLRYHHQQRDKNVYSGFIGINGKRAELACMTPVPPWLASGSRIATNDGPEPPLKVLAVDPWLCVVEGVSDVWAIDTSIVVAHWHAAEVSS